MLYSFCIVFEGEVWAMTFEETQNCKECSVFRVCDKHLKVPYPKSLNHLCPFCPEILPSSEDLDIHIIMIHRRWENKK